MPFVVCKQSKGVQKLMHFETKLALYFNLSNMQLIVKAFIPPPPRQLQIVFTSYLFFKRHAHITINKQNFGCSTMFPCFLSFWPLITSVKDGKVTWKILYTIWTTTTCPYLLPNGGGIQWSDFIRRKNKVWSRKIRNLQNRSALCIIN